MRSVHSGAPLLWRCVAVAVAVSALMLSLGGPSGASTSRVRVPRGWVTVAFGGVKVSVPETWHIERAKCPRATTLDLTTSSSPVLNCPEEALANVDQVSVRQLDSPVPDQADKSVVINGIRLYAPRANQLVVTWYSPSLHLLITVSGPVGKRAFRTLRPARPFAKKGRHA